MGELPSILYANRSEKSINKKIKLIIYTFVFVDFLIYFLYSFLINLIFGGIMFRMFFLLAIFTFFGELSATDNIAIEEMIQGNDSSDISTPNPLQEDEVNAADVYARALGRKAYPFIKNKIKHPQTVMIGIGRLFSNSIGPMGNGINISRKDLRKYISASIGLSDEELNNPFANVDVSNAILVLGFMKALHIHEIQILDTKSTRGLLIYSPYWE